MKRQRLLALVMAALLLVASAPVEVARAAGSYNMPYYIVVDVSSQIVTVYETATQNIARQMICSSGANNRTPLGVFTMPMAQRKSYRVPWYWIGAYSRYVKYASRIYKGILFHSIPYMRKSLLSIDKEAAETLGYPTSHGCIRLRWEDSQFISENCLAGTKVKIYKSGERNDDLRELLLQESYDAGTGLSYDAFLGIPSEEGVLGRFSEGQEVLNLQYRLRDLGLYDGELNGVYGSATVNAVRVAQTMMEADASGMADADFQQRIYSQDAPTAMDVRLAEGMSGPAVRSLQNDLTVLCLYTDDPDSVFDQAVVEAVKGFQKAYGYEEDGVATPEVQKAIHYEAEKVQEAFAGSDYTCEWASDTLNFARAKARSGLKLREEASQKSKQIKRLSDGTGMLVLEKGDHWSRVRAGSDEGYAKNSFLRFTEREIALLKYTSRSDDSVYTVGNSAQDYYASGKLPCEVFAEYLAANEQKVDVSSLADYATVNTQGAGEFLNLREAPNTDSAVLDTVENGKRLAVQRRYTDWTQVNYRGQEGYLLNEYLDFWTGPEDALNEELDDDKVDASMVKYAVVESSIDEAAGVYDDDSDEAKLLGHLPDETQVDVVDMAEGWCLISYRDHQGYMLAEDLRLVLEDEDEEELEPAPEPIPEGEPIPESEPLPEESLPEAPPISEDITVGAEPVQG